MPDRKSFQDSTMDVYFAILIDGDATPPYPVPRQESEPIEAFSDRIASIVVLGNEDYPYTAFMEVIDATHGVEDKMVSALVVDAMERQRSLRL